MFFYDKNLKIHFVKQLFLYTIHIMTESASRLADIYVMCLATRPQNNNDLINIVAKVCREYGDKEINYQSVVGSVLSAIENSSPFKISLREEKYAESLWVKRLMALIQACLEGVMYLGEGSCFS